LKFNDQVDMKFFMPFHLLNQEKINAHTQRSFY